jgi:hypothetical protein
MGVWKNIIGLIGDSLQINFTGPKIVGSSTDTVTIKDKDDGDGKLIAATQNVENLEISDGVERKTTVTMATGGAGDITMVLPNNDGDNGNVLVTNGSGTLTWTDIDAPQVGILTLNYDDGASQSLSAAKSGRFIDKIIVKVTTAFDGTTPGVDIGITGTTDKYVDTTEVDLTTVGTYVIEVANYESGSEEILVTFTAGGGASEGVAEITMIESQPTVTA